MYQPSYSANTKPLQKWKAKKLDLIHNASPNRSSSSYSEFTETSITPSPIPKSPSSTYNSVIPLPPPTPTPTNSDFKIKLKSSEKVPGLTSSFDIPITRSLYLKLKNQSTAAGTLIPSDEIDYLTSLLMDSLANSDDPHIVGMCYKCGLKVSGEENGCLALGRIYHIQCFTCITCQNTLRNGPFYSLNDKFYCQRDYLNTLEKCSSCHQPITDKILNAENNTYHASCFNCKECNSNLDGIPFALNEFGEHHCVPCFHQKYAPKCSKCYKPIAPSLGEVETVRVQALNRNFHLNCYKCDDCLLPLSRGRELDGCYPHSGLILCQRCYNIRVESKIDIRSVI